jgi:hypothetical protein
MVQVMIQALLAPSDTSGARTLCKLARPPVLPRVGDEFDVAEHSGTVTNADWELGEDVSMKTSPGAVSAGRT